MNGSEVSSFRHLLSAGTLALALGASPIDAQWSGAGDLNLTGDRDVMDVVVLASHIVGNARQGFPPFLAPLAAAEVNADGVVDVFDLLLLQGFIVGNVPELPVGGVTVYLPGNVPLVLVKVPNGTFQMGAPEGEASSDPSERPVHAVTLTGDYYIGRYEVTRAQWVALMGSDPSDASSSACGGCPVESVSWDDVTSKGGGFLAKLNLYLSATGQPGAGAYRLPTEAEWEYAARGGTQTRFSFGDALDCQGLYELSCIAMPFAWWLTNSGLSTHTAGLKQPNPFHLYDVHGNVSEWVQDLWGPYPSSPESDPTGPASGSERVLRGGSWLDGLDEARSASRLHQSPTFRYYTFGFRVARSGA